MGLTSQDGGGAERSAAPLPRRPTWALPVYIWGVIVAGCLILAASLVLAPLQEALGASAWGDPYPSRGLVLVILVLTVIVGELRPVPVPRGGDVADMITISTTFTLTLAIVGPLSLALIAQGVAVLIDDTISRRSPLKMAFNVSQYVLTVTAAHTVYSLVAGEPVFGPYNIFEPVPIELWAALVAAAAFLVVNQILVSAVVAFDSGERVGPIFAADLRFQAMTTGVLAVLAPVAALIVQTQPLMLPMLIAPIAAVYNSARLAVAMGLQASHDSLTGLANRELFRARAVRALEDSQRTSQALAIMMIDLDHFKEINDTLGHQVGDELIREVAHRLEEARPEGATVARLGGDEFAVLLPDIPDLSVAEDVATYLLSVLSKSFSVGGVRLVVQASLGIALSPDHGDDVHTLMRRSDIALYEAKRERARFCAYSNEDEDVHTPQRLTILTDLRSAVEDDQLFLVYQPKINVTSGEVCGVEALVRWNHPTRGIQYPDTFIPLAENTGLIAPITFFVLERALRQVRTWQESGIDLSVAVNLSVRHLTDMSLPDRIAVALERWGVAPSKLVIEVTESSIMTDPKRGAVVLQQLRRIGVEVSIDDYGTGHASLNYLKQFDIDELKIDRSFIMNLDIESSDAIIVASTVELGHNLGLRIVAEGVEDGDTLAWLTGLGCDIAQGYYIGRPMAPDAVVEVVEQRRLESKRHPSSALRLVGSN
ncbi:MAG: EAL domain-containing protein [Actinomycetia bacterium]|nr:EAL domain-containing protein [Actinomycetes bacterium]